MTGCSNASTPDGPAAFDVTGYHSGFAAFSGREYLVADIDGADSVADRCDTRAGSGEKRASARASAALD